MHLFLTSASSLYRIQADRSFHTERPEQTVLRCPAISRQLAAKAMISILPRVSTEVGALWRERFLTGVYIKFNFNLWLPPYFITGCKLNVKQPKAERSPSGTRDQLAPHLSNLRFIFYIKKTFNLKVVGGVISGFRFSKTRGVLMQRWNSEIRAMFANNLILWDQGLSKEHNAKDGALWNHIRIPCFLKWLDLRILISQKWF